MTIEERWNDYFDECYSKTDPDIIIPPILKTEFQKCFYGGFAAGLFETKRAFESPNIEEVISNFAVEALTFAINLILENTEPGKRSQK